MYHSFRVTWKTFGVVDKLRLAGFRFTVQERADVFSIVGKCHTITVTPRFLP